MITVILKYKFFVLCFAHLWIFDYNWILIQKWGYTGLCLFHTRARTHTHTYRYHHNHRWQCWNTEEPRVFQNKTLFPLVLHHSATLTTFTFLRFYSIDTVYSSNIWISFWSSSIWSTSNVLWIFLSLSSFVSDLPNLLFIFCFFIRMREFIISVFLNISIQQVCLIFR